MQCISCATVLAIWVVEWCSCWVEACSSRGQLCTSIMAISTYQRACRLAAGGSPCLTAFRPVRQYSKAWILKRAFKPAKPSITPARVRCCSTSEEKRYTITTPLYYVNAGEVQRNCYSQATLQAAAGLYRSMVATTLATGTYQLTACRSTSHGQRVPNHRC